jgi:hypothetical protein
MYLVPAFSRGGGGQALDGAIGVRAVPGEQEQLSVEKGEEHE